MQALIAERESLKKLQEAYSHWSTNLAAGDVNNIPRVEDYLDKLFLCIEEKKAWIKHLERIK